MKFNKLTFAISLFVFGLGAFFAWKFLKPSVETDSEPVANISDNRDKVRASNSREDIQPELDSGFQPGFGEWGTYQPEENQKGGEQNPFEKMLKDPKLRETLSSQVQTQVGHLYSDLFEMLRLDPERQNKLKALLADRALGRLDMGFELMSGDMSEEAINQKKQKIAAAKEESDKSIRDLLGENGSQAFEKYEKSLPERQQIKGIRAQFEANGVSLPKETETELMDMMHDEREKHPWVHNFYDENSFDPTNLNKENIAKFIEQKDEVRHNILLRASRRFRASGKWSKEQMDAFRSALDQQTGMEKMAMEMIPN